MTTRRAASYRRGVLVLNRNPADGGEGAGAPGFFRKLRGVETGQDKQRHHEVDPDDDDQRQNRKRGPAALSSLWAISFGSNEPAVAARSRTIRSSDACSAAFAPSVERASAPFPGAVGSGIGVDSLQFALVEIDIAPAQAA